MAENKFSFKDIPNFVYGSLMALVFIVLIFFNKNVGYSAFSTQLMKIDTLQNECDQLRQQISADSLIIVSLSDSVRLDRFLHEKMLFVGEGETMYEIVDTTVKDHGAH